MILLIMYPNSQDKEYAKHWPSGKGKLVFLLWKMVQMLIVWSFLMEEDVRHSWGKREELR